MLRLIKRNYFLLISLFLILYFGFNLVSGERGLFSYIEKKELLFNLKNEELTLISKIEDMDHKNSLLSTNLDLDYIEDSSADVDANFVLTDEMELVEVQSSAEGSTFSKLQFNEMLSLAESGLSSLVSAQKKAVSTNA